VPFRYRIFGVVRESESGLPLAGLRVHAFDEDLLFDDDLGEATTDDAGRFEIDFTELRYRDVFEQRPDVYLRILAPDRRELFVTRVRRDAKGDEDFDVRIPRDSLAGLALAAAASAQRGRE
jgi:hypothetical protein